MQPVSCDVRRVSQNILKLNITSALLEDMDDLYVRFILFYRYTTYRKFLVDRWENVCAYLAGKPNRGTEYLDVFYINWRNLSSIDHPCPMQKGDGPIN